MLLLHLSCAYDNGIFASSEWDAQTMVSITGIATTTQISNNVTERLFYVETGESTGNVKMYHTKPSNGGWAIGGGLAVYKL